jgi:FAD/FMN-containing dehydrogenase
MAPLFSFSSLLGFALVTSGAIASTATASNDVAPSVDAGAACDEIKTALLNKLFVAKDTGYQKENAAYYNVGLSELMPRCIAMPSSAQDVSAIVKILNKHAGVRFAIKSGGHDPNPGQSSVKDGVLIAMKNIAGTTNDKEKQVAYIKPGGRWSDAIGPLAKENVTVVSGRLGKSLAKTRVNPNQY